MVFPHLRHYGGCASRCANPQINDNARDCDPPCFIAVNFFFFILNSPLSLDVHRCLREVFFESSKSKSGGTFVMETIWEWFVSGLPQAGLRQSESLGNSNLLLRAFVTRRRIGCIRDLVKEVCPWALQNYGRRSNWSRRVDVGSSPGTDLPVASHRNIGQYALSFWVLMKTDSLCVMLFSQSAGGYGSAGTQPERQAGGRRRTRRVPGGKPGTRLLSSSPAIAFGAMR